MVAAWLALMFLGTITTVVGEYSGVVVGIYPESRNQSDYEHVMIRLENGDVIETSLPSRTGFQHPIGTAVSVTVYQGALVHQKSYVAKISTGDLGSNNSLKGTP